MLPAWLKAIFSFSPEFPDSIDKGIKKKTSELKPLCRTHESMDAYAAEKFKTAKEQQPKSQPTRFNFRRLYQGPRISPTTPAATSPQNLGGGGSR